MGFFSDTYNSFMKLFVTEEAKVFEELGEVINEAYALENKKFYGDIENKELYPEYFVNNCLNIRELRDKYKSKEDIFVITFVKHATGAESVSDFFTVYEDTKEIIIKYMAQNLEDGIVEHFFFETSEAMAVSEGMKLPFMALIDKGTKSKETYFSDIMKV